MSLMLSLASEATAFHSSTPEPFAMLHRRAVRDTSTEAYGRQNFPRKTSISTRLHYREGIEDPQAVKSSVVSSSSNWWDNLFPSPSDSVNEQDSVDEYLEFLDRRYNRLHEEREEKPFSAINWLLQEPEESEVVVASQQQKDDALYVLGVAGLASQKLLQKHPQLSAEQGPKLKEATSVSIEALDAIATSADGITFGNLVIRKLLVPLVKVLYFVNRRKQIFLNVQSRRARQLIGKAARTTLRTVVYGPVKAIEAILDIGGGRSNVISTLAIASTMFLLMRPLIQAVVTESPV